MNWREKYSELLHRSAEKWGLTAVPGRPLIDDRASPYPAPTDTEILRWENGKYEHLDVRLFIFNGQWGYSMSASFSEGGFGYGSCFKFCDPFPSRSAALRAAHTELQRRVKEKGRSGYQYRSSGPALTWLEKLSQPEQLTLF